MNKDEIINLLKRADDDRHQALNKLCALEQRLQDATLSRDDKLEIKSYLKVLQTLASTLTDTCNDLLNDTYLET